MTSDGSGGRFRTLFGFLVLLVLLGGLAFALGRDIQQYGLMAMIRGTSDEMLAATTGDCITSPRTPTGRSTWFRPFDVVPCSDESARHRVLSVHEDITESERGSWGQWCEVPPTHMGHWIRLSPFGNGRLLCLGPANE